MAAVVPYGSLSIHHFIDKVGADAGFAAIIGVALVVIMLFIHARETATLRDRAEDAEERVEYLERAVEQLGRVATQATQLAQAAQTQSGQARPGVAAAPAAARSLSTAQRPVPAPAVAAAYATAAAAPRTSGPPPQLPAAPFGTAGPALSSATRLIPEPDSASSNGRVNGNGNGAAVPAPAPAPSPSTAAAGAPTPMPQIPSVQRPPDARADTSPPRSRQADPGSRAPRRDYGRGSESRSRGRVLPALVAVALIAVIAVAAVLVLGHHHSHKGAPSASSSQTHSSTTTRKAASGKKGKHAVSVNPKDVTVAVLNGTMTANLAADVSQKLAGVGFQQGKTTNFSSQSLTTTTIGYLSRGDRPQALAVAKALKVKYHNVLQVNSSTKQLVCPAGASCPDQVFVVLGSDLDSDA